MKKSKKNNAKYLRKNSGITLIALAITVIVLALLVGVSLSEILGDEGIIAETKIAVSEHEIAAEEEKLEMKIYQYELAATVSGNVDGATMEEIFDKLAEDEEFEIWGVNTGASAKIASEFAAKAQTIDKSKITEIFVRSISQPAITLKITSDRQVESITSNEQPDNGENEGNDSGNTGNSGNNTVPEEPAIQTYSVTYNTNGGTGSVPASAEYEEGNTITVNFTTVPTKGGYTFLGWATTADAGTATYTSSGTTSFTMGTSNVTLYAVWKEETKTFVSQITKDNYGEYVDLGTTYVKGKALEKGTAEEDWRIFYADENGIILVLADYLPYLHEDTLGTGLSNKGTKYPNNWSSDVSRVDLIDRLKGTSSDFGGVNPWNKMIDEKYAGKGIEVTGGLELETWVKSWNEKGYTNLKTAKSAKMDDNLEGYYIGTSENPTGTYQSVKSDVEGYGNTLYFPHKQGISSCKGYWLAAPSAYGGTLYVVTVNYSGFVERDTHARYGYDGYGYGVRPAVYLPSDIKAKKVDGVWKLEI